MNPGRLLRQGESGYSSFLLRTLLLYHIYDVLSRDISVFLFFLKQHKLFFFAHTIPVQKQTQGGHDYANVKLFRNYLRVQQK